MKKYSIKNTLIMNDKINWSEICEMAEVNEDTEIINLDGSAKNRQVSLFSNEYDVAKALQLTSDGEIDVIWVNNVDGSISTSRLDSLDDDLFGDVIESI